MLPWWALLACTKGPALDEGGGPAPPPTTGEVVRFVALGDAGEGNDPQRRVAAAMARWCQEKADERGPGCHFVAYLGDNFYPEGVTGPDDPQWTRKWADVYQGLGLPFYAILGNHDHGDPPLDRLRAAAQLQGPADLPGWVMPGPWYAFDAGPARVLALDTSAVMMGWTHEEQADWARAELDAAGDRPVVVLAHHAFKSNGQHGNAGEYEGSAWIPYASGGRILDLYTDVLCDRADLVLSGHEHNRQWLQPVCGMELVVLGAGAKNTPLVGRGTPTLFEEDRERGFAWFELTAQGLVGEVVDEHGRLDFRREVTWR